MLSVFICEDDIKQREKIVKFVNDTILIEALDMEIKLITDNPDELLDYLSIHKMTGLYFLDVDLKHEITGIELGALIREYDDLGKIVFVTTHSELAHLTFKYKVEALDYIIKDDIDKLKQRIRDCILLAQKRYLQDNNPKTKNFVVKLGEKVRSFELENIMFFEASDHPHRIVMHLHNSQFEFYGSMKEIEDFDKSFYRCSKSVLVNKNNISTINKTSRELKMVNGQICQCSFRAMNGLLKNKELKI